MVTSGKTQSDFRGPHGSGAAELAELRRDLARPSRLDDGHRQRLLDLAQRVARVQGLGGEYSRVSLSEYVSSAIAKVATVA